MTRLALWAGALRGLPKKYKDDFLANFYGFYLNFGDNVVYVDPLFDHPVIYHCDLETVCIAGLETAICICQLKCDLCDGCLSM